MLNTNDILLSLEDRLVNRDVDLSSLSPEEQYELLVRHSVHIVKPDLLIERLRNSKKTGIPLNVKYGIDPTSKDVHLGHMVPVIVAKMLMQMGHKVTLLFGDFTALVGDPTGKVKTRPMLTSTQIAENVSDYKNLVGKFIDMSKVEVAYNSPFYEALTIKDLMQIYRVNKLQPLLQRDDFRTRLDGLTIAEALYPTLMAIDSIFMKPDIELGGNDQLLNFVVTNELLRSQNLPEECAITTDLLLGIAGDGSKMSKSKNNYISLRDTPKDIFGKIMSLPDSMLNHYFSLLTPISSDDWELLSQMMQSNKLNPMFVKKLLGRVLVTIMYSAELAKDAQSEFDKTFSKNEVPDEVSQYVVTDIKDLGLQPWVKLLVDTGMVKSNREARDHIANGALRLLHERGWVKINDVNDAFPDKTSFIIKVGKRRFFQINIQK